MTNFDIIATRKVPACNWNETAQTAPKVKAKRNLWAYTFWIGGAVQHCTTGHRGCALCIAGSRILGVGVRAFYRMVCG